MTNELLFQPLQFRNLTVDNRLFRSSISGRFDNYNGSGTSARINWETKFAKGGVGAIISSFVPVHLEGRILPNYAMIDADDKIPFWRELGKRVHDHGTKYILQLSHSGRQRDVPGVENFMGAAPSSTGEPDTVHGLPARAMTLEEIRQTIGRFADGARRVREAGLDGIELHASHGYLFTQFLSSAINDREDEYGGATPEERARFLLDVIAAIRKEIGSDFHLQVKLNARDYADAVSPSPFASSGNSLEDSVAIGKLVERAGADALHVSIGSIFPHPLMPPGGTPPDELSWWYGALVSSGTRGFVNYMLFHFAMLRPVYSFLWNRIKKKHRVEGVCMDDARVMKEAVNIPVLCTGGFQRAALINKVLAEGYCDGVTMARPLIANNDLPKFLKEGKEPDEPCTFCNRCLVNAPANPLGCYDLRRFGGDRDAMIREVMSVFDPPEFAE